MYVQTTLVKRKSEKSTLIIWDGAGAHGMKKGDIMLRIVPVASLALIKKRRTARSDVV